MATFSTETAVASASASNDPSRFNTWSQEIRSLETVVETEAEMEQANATTVYRTHAALNEPPTVALEGSISTTEATSALDFTSANKDTTHVDILSQEDLSLVESVGTTNATVNSVLQEAQCHQEAMETNATVHESPGVGASFEESTATNVHVGSELARLGPMPSAFFVSQGILDVEEFLAHKTKGLALALAEFREDNGQKKQGLPTLCTYINRWRRDVRQRRETLQENVQGLDPMFEIFNGEVRAFLAAKSISKPQDLLECEGKSIGLEWKAWRKANSLSNVKPNAAIYLVFLWRQSVKEQLGVGLADDTAVQLSVDVPCDFNAPTRRSIHVPATAAITSNDTACTDHLSQDVRYAEEEVETNEAPGRVLPFDELARLGPLPRAFFDSQGILNIAGFLKHSATSLAHALAEFRKDSGQKKLGLPTLRLFIHRWRRNVLQRRDTLTENVQGLHPTFEIFDGEVRAFLAAKSISAPQDLLDCHRGGLSREWKAWRKANSLSIVKPSVAVDFVGKWRYSINEQLAVDWVDDTAVQLSVDVPCDFNAPTRRSSRRRTATAAYQEASTEQAPMNELPFDELARLGPLPRAFFDSQGMLDVASFLAHSAASLAPELSEFREDNDQPTLGFSTLRRYICRWRRDVLQRRETLTEGVRGLHSTFEIFDGDVRSFLTAESIFTPQDLLNWPMRDICDALNVWRQANSLTAVHAKSLVVKWRQSINEQLAVGWVEKHGATPVALQEVETFVPVNPGHRDSPMTKKRLRRTAVKRTYPGLSSDIGSPTTAMHSKDHILCTAFSPGTDATGPDSVATVDAELPSTGARPSQKRARLEESVVPRVVGRVGTSTTTSIESATRADSEQK